MNESDNRGLIVFAAAQTGGHLLPAVETGRVMAEMGFKVMMVSSGQAIEKEILKDSGMELRTLRVERIKAMGALGAIKGMFSVPGALVTSGTMLRELRPSAVVGFGGFTSGPFVLAASLMRIPSAIFEANSVPGITNRILARAVKTVFLTFPVAGRAFGRKDFIVTGNPVRKEIIETRKDRWALPGNRLLVFGGSQGSRFLNVNMPEVAGVLSNRVKGLVVRHQCGLGNSGPVADAYRANGVTADVSDYIHDMAGAYRWADFAVCRSGAGTVAEITAVGMPAMFVPFALAADDHQTHNARNLSTTGAALMVSEQEFDARGAADSIADVMQDADRLNSMSIASGKAGRVDAAVQIAEGIAKLVKR